MRFRLLPLAICLATVSCAALQRFQFDPPTAQLAGVAVTGLGLTGGSLDFKLDVYNPNGYGLRTTRLQVGIALENTPFGEAVLERPLQLEPKAHNEVHVPLTFTWSGVGAGARALLGKGSVQYGLTGRLLVDTPVGERGAELRTSGVVTVTDLVR